MSRKATSQSQPESDRSGSASTKRIPVDFPLFREAVLVLLAYVDGTTKTQKIKSLVITELDREELLSRLHRSLEREAGAKGLTTDELIRKILKEEELLPQIEAELTDKGNLEILLTGRKNQ